VLFCQQENIKPILGAEIRNGDKLLYILIAANNNGFTWINHFISKHVQQDQPFPEQATVEPFFLSQGDGFVIYPIHTKPPDQLLANEYIGVQPSEVSKLFNWSEGALRTNQPQWKHKLVVRQPVTFKDKTYFNVHRLLRAIDRNALLSKLSPETVCGPTEYFLSQNKILEAFKQYPFIVTNTYRLMDVCEIKMDFGTDKNKKTFSARKRDDAHLLRKLALDGFQQRYGANNVIARERVDKELDIINRLGFLIPIF
jgi:DNA polymerase-3 subunit alpha